MDGIITTIKQNCRRCYTCVRDCPAKAIRFEEGQASVVAERCISCGNCTMVCSQDAKAYASGVDGALRLLEQGSEVQRGGPVAALLAPSFPVGFSVPPAQVIGALREAGFTYVIEVAYGADLVNEACREYLEKNPTGLHIASACPAVVEYVRKYHPRSHRPDHAHRLPHGRHRAGGQRALRPAGALRLHRALRGQEVRDARSAGGECYR